MDTDEHNLRIHIRQLLLNYAVTHFTADYIQLTEQAVTDLWCQYLTEIPTADPGSILLPKDPFDTLTRIHDLGSVEAFQEKFQSTPNAIQYIKKLIKPRTGKPKSERVSFHESSFESHIPVCRPMSPILTTRAIRETPKPGSNKFLDSLSLSHREFLSSQAIKNVPIEPILDPPVKQDEILNTNWRLLPQEQDAVRSLLRSVFAPRPKGYKNRHLDPCARPDSPPVPSRVPEPPFIPIFPRRHRAGNGIREHDTGLTDIISLPAVILPPAKVEELEPDLYKQNMVIVNGWHAYKSSPSPTPTPPSSQEDQIDELFMLSPDTTPPPIRPSKMEVAQIPRTKRIGAPRKKPVPIGHGTNFGSFLAPLVQKAPAPEPLSRLSPEPATSILGQPDSACEPDVVLDDLDADLDQLYGHQRQDPRDLILREKVDEKQQLLMEVPVLPPPNDHPLNGSILPSHLRELVVPLKDKGQANVKNPTHRFLKKAKGIPSLNVELSWVPIAAKTRIPTNCEIMKVTDLFDADALSSSDLPMQNAAFLERVPAALSTPEPRPQETWIRRFAKIFPVIPEDIDSEITRCEIILSRKERRRAAGLTDEVEDDMGDSDDSMDTEEPESRCAKRPKLLTQDEYLDDSGVAFDTLDLDHGSPTSPSFYGDPEPDVDKENLVPWNGGRDDDFAPPEHNEQFDPEDIPRSPFPSNFQANYYDPGMASGYEHRDFEALSFDSLATVSAQPTQLPAHDIPSDETYAGMFDPYPDAIINDSAIAKPSSATASAPDIATRSLGIFEFAKLRAKKVSVPILDNPTSSWGETNVRLEEPSYSVPENVYDRDTLRLPSTWNPPQSLHRYMVSMELVQKQSLIRSLRSRTCSIDLVERDSLGGVDIILDPHTAVIYTNLLVLPSECTPLASRIGQQSWLYSRLLIIFDAYPSSRSYQSKAKSNTASELFAYSPPVLKALGKLRRNLGIAEGCGTKRRACAVQYAFADTVEEAAMFTRYLGDFAEDNDESRGIVWGDRTWLEDDVPEGEQDLAAADGMNRFASFLILCQIDLSEFLDLSQEARVEKFGVFIGMERIMLLNQVIERRLQAMQPSDSEMVDPSVLSVATQQY
ncbi:hypothetical protein DFH07DRAFT_839946 [Mycena maculata]|uniref:Uncharacterized protein n=1 Tax=Mycena maculata TaxID=230809 RepID=A0AAD7IBY8_9AGAR|nr:hypothetical protein DFH07DRAFT_839946 [Mycena maculata]